MTTYRGVVTPTAGSTLSGYNVDTFTGDGSDVTFSLTGTLATSTNIWVYLDGVHQANSNFSISAGVITFDTAPVDGSDIQVVYGEILDTGTPSAGSVDASRLSSSNSDLVAMTAKLRYDAANTAYVSTGTLEGALDELSDSENIVYKHGATGTVNRTVESKHQEHLTAADFGIYPSNTAVQNDVVMRAMRDYMLLDRAVHYHVTYAPGTYVYTINTWLWRINKLTFNAYGCTFFNESVSAFGEDRNPIVSGDMWTADGDTLRADSTYPYITGDLVDAALMGDTSITCSTASDAANHSIGDWVFVHCFDQQFTGFPPNVRNFDYLKVTSSDSGTGVVGFDHALTCNYSVDMIETAANLVYFGKPRILSLNRNNGLDVYDVNEYREFNGGFWTQTTPTSGSTFRSGPAIKAICNDVDMLSFLPGAKDCVVNGGTIGHTDVDKNIDTVVFNSTNFIKINGVDNDIVGATGVKSLIFNECIFEGHTISLESYNLKFDGCIFNQTGNQASTPISFLKLGSGWCVESFTLTNNTFNSGNNSNLQALVATAGYNPTLTVTSVGGAGEIELTNDATNKIVVRQLREGMSIVNDTGPNYGTIVKITYNSSSDKFIIAGSWDAPTASDVFRYATIGSFTSFGNTVHGNYNHLRDTTQGYGGGLNPALTVNSVTEIYSFNANEIPYSGFYDIYTAGYIKSVKMNVLKAYSGAANSYFTLRINAADTILNFQLSSAGNRYITEYMSQGIESGDTVNIENMGKYASYFRVIIAGGAGLSGTNDEMPVVTLEVEVYRPKKFANALHT